MKPFAGTVPRNLFTLALLLLGAVLFTTSFAPVPGLAAGEDTAGGAAAEIKALQAEVARLKQVVPDQSHAMKDVAYHFANLWFAAKEQNWPLAEFYWSETRSHLAWAVRIIPVRKDPQGRDLKLADILAPIEKTSLEEVHKAIQARDASQFQGAYRQMLDSCYACHLAAGKPYLRLHVPTQPEATLIQFTPAP